jgi:peptidoglycan hydrolase-like protein with peptidoglycan-binding domain
LVAIARPNSAAIASLDSQVFWSFQVTRGNRVTDLQKALQQAGFGVGNVDGIFGPMTRDAVTAFQQSASLPATGIADDKTLQTLATKAAPGPINGAGPLQPPQPPSLPPGSLQPGDVLRILLEQLGKLSGAAGGAAPGGAPPGAPTGASILQQILMAAFKPAGLAAPAPGAAPTGATTPTTDGAGPPVLSPIDQVLGGQALAGKKTALAIVAYATMAILQAAGVVTAGSPAGMILNTLIVAFGGLGGLSKIDRVIQTLGTIAAKPPG